MSIDQSGILPVSLVIPFLGSTEEAILLISSISAANTWPAEVLIIDSTFDLESGLELHVSMCSTIPASFLNLIRFIVPTAKLFPGEARNIGIRAARYANIAFLDLCTIPTHSWLKSAYDLFVSCGSTIVIGTTRYIGTSHFRRLFIRATYGERPLCTVPGSLMHRSVLQDVGLFLPKIRAGEDTEWLSRAHQFGYLPSPIRAPALTYKAIPGSLLDLAKKWYRNYRSCSPVVFHLETQKAIYVIAANFILLFIAFRWNAIIAAWDESSLLYLSNVSKITLVSLISLYWVIRGLLLPMQRGTILRSLVPLDWIALGFICLVLDFAKLLAFVLPPWRNRSFL